VCVYENRMCIVEYVYEIGYVSEICVEIGLYHIYRVITHIERNPMCIVQYVCSNKQQICMQYGVAATSRIC